MSDSGFSQVRVRFAPSPTGKLHVGNARVAIFNCVFARSLNGKFLVRVEDTDLERSSLEFEKSIFESLAWLGLSPDEKPVRQSENLKNHLFFIEKLISEKKAYKCFCSKETLEALKSQNGELGFRYPGTCRDLVEPEDKKKPFVVRFRLEGLLPEKVFFQDQIKGKIEVEREKLDDFVILRESGVPTYNFAATIDDFDMKISHVIRGEDHIINTFKQIEIYKSINAKVPEFAHLPMILGSSGARLSKRDGSTSVQDFKEQGFISEALFNYLVRLGFSLEDKEVFSRDEVIKSFKISKVNKSNARFDFEKLKWLNSVYLKELSFQSFLESLSSFDKNLFEKLKESFKEDKKIKLFELYKDRAFTLVELANLIINLSEFVKSKKIDPELEKEFLNHEKKALIKEYCQTLEKNKARSSKEFLVFAKEITTQKGLKIKDLTIPLRVFLTGSPDGPGVFKLLEILGF